MTIAYLNGEFVPLEQARISPLDRGFLFGDGIYEVIPSYQGKMVGFNQHMARFANGLAAIEIDFSIDKDEWRTLVQRLIDDNRETLGDNIGVYLHISRGADTRRFHAYPEGVTPTVFGFAFALSAPVKADRSIHPGASVSLAEDLRWERCHIKSTALLGNVMHFQQSVKEGNAETILYNHQHEITEASSSNVFIIKNGEAFTPPLDNQLLPGITRMLVIECLAMAGIPLTEKVITVDELLAADEVWITSSGKEMLPIVSVGGQQISNGKVGPVWEQVFTIYSEQKFVL
ncbi:D-amino acid aminotransferase [Alteromonas lipolytica]|uniref:Aminodeoxychorismate lyase n=1 Tax=Alteromonas lipolytica TaxID=1856405 RepID=A0A1E8FIU0_9ALTE|nr:D-amino acid aminotransferase [Alteromonas lipolytica]OFI35861.1 D-alanine aminotransferase [Alteromonas lipolytica]GGF81450.1 cytochrome c550 [Alteromonas lipolytica]